MDKRHRRLPLLLLGQFCLALWNMFRFRAMAWYDCAGEYVMLGWVIVTPPVYPGNAEMAGSLGIVKFPGGACGLSYHDLVVRDGRDRPFPGKKRPWAFESEGPPKWGCEGNPTTIISGAVESRLQDKERS